uniref:Uncharacterized protein n=1 Tax=Myoviridae sp. cteBs22 TaxID=2826675 RepID=A0A8S5R0W9_9CAUD|nr:MAG TPA: hypothetical protein [Myoviridae sp. cteBs22]
MVRPLVHTENSIRKSKPRRFRRSAGLFYQLNWS